MLYLGTSSTCVENNDYTAIQVLNNYDLQLASYINTLELLEIIRKTVEDLQNSLKTTDQPSNVKATSSLPNGLTNRVG